MTETVEVTIKDIERLRLEPGDVLVYTTTLKLRPWTVEVIKDALKQKFGADIPVVILDMGGRLQVVNKDELEQNA